MAHPVIGAVLHAVRQQPGREGHKGAIHPGEGLFFTEHFVIAGEQPVKQLLKIRGPDGADPVADGIVAAVQPLCMRKTPEAGRG